MRDSRNTYTVYFQRALEELDQKEEAIQSVGAWLEGDVEEQDFFALLEPERCTKYAYFYSACGKGARVLLKTPLFAQYIHMLYRIAGETAWDCISSDLRAEEIAHSDIRLTERLGMLAHGYYWQYLRELAAPRTALLQAAMECVGEAKWLLMAMYLSGTKKGGDAEYLAELEKVLPRLTQRKENYSLACAIAWLLRKVSKGGDARWIGLCRIEPEHCYSVCDNCGGEEFLREMRQLKLDEELKKKYIIWLGEYDRFPEELRYYWRKEERAFTAAFSACGSIRESDGLIRIMKESEKGRNILSSKAEAAVRGFLQELSGNDPAYGRLMEEYLEGRSDGQLLWEKMRSYKGTKWNANPNEMEHFLTYFEIRGIDERTVKMFLWIMKTHSSYGYDRVWYKSYDQRTWNTAAVFAMMRRVYPGESCIEAILEQEFDKKEVIADQNALFRRILAEDRDGFLRTVPNVCASGRAFLYDFLMKEDPRNAETLLSYLDDTAKAPRSRLLEVLKEHPELEGKVQEKLRSKKTLEREAAIELLQSYGTEEGRNSLREALKTEKSVKLLEKLRAALGEEEGVIRIEVRSNMRKTLSWLDPETLPQLVKKDQTTAEAEYGLAIMSEYASMDVCGINQRAISIASQLDPESLGNYAYEVLERWFRDGAQAKRKWVLYFASIHGTKEVVDVLKRQIQEWPNCSRGAIAAEAVYALALHPGDSALIIVDSISRKFKYRQVKAAAQKALDFAAHQLGITVEQLADRIVPDLGFDSNGHQRVDYGKRSFDIYLTSALELEVVDGKGKRLKSLPAPGKNDEPGAQAAYESYKQMKKEMKTAIAAQRLRLEQALSVERRWTGKEWKELFVKKPIMHQFAIGLIWGCYEGSKVTTTFRYMEDGTFNTADEEEMELPEDSFVGLVHPMELSEETKALWKEQLADYEIRQPILQLERPVYNKDEAALETFIGRKINSLSFRGKMEKIGWIHGPVEDGGMYYEFHIENEQQKIGARLNLEWSNIVPMPDEETCLERVEFYWASRTLSLDEVPARFYSEVMYQLNSQL